MQTLILTLHIIVCFLLIILVLLQSGKEGMGVIFGGGNSSVFGSTGAGGVLAKLTTLMAIIFIITSLSYTYVTSSRPGSESVILNVKIEEPESKPEPEKSVETPAPPVENNDASQSEPKPDEVKPAPSADNAKETGQSPAQSEQPAPAPKP